MNDDDSNQFTVRLSYDTCGDGPADAVETMLAAIETGNVYVEVFDEGGEHSCLEGELFEILPKKPEKRKPATKPVPPPRLKAVEGKRYYTVQLNAADAARIDWPDLWPTLTCGFPIDDESYSDKTKTMGFSMAVADEHWMPNVLNAIEEHLEAQKNAAFEEIEGFGSF